MKTYIISSLLIFVSFLVSGQDLDLNITAEYISDNKISIKIKNLTNDTVSMSISPDMGSPWSGMTLTFIKNNKDTIDHYFVSIYDKLILYIPPHLVYENIFQTISIKKNTDAIIDIFLRYIVRSKPSKKKYIRKKIRLKLNKKSQNKILKYKTYATK